MERIFKWYGTEEANVNLVILILTNTVRVRVHPLSAIRHKKDSTMPAWWYWTFLMLGFLPVKGRWQCLSLLEIIHLTRLALFQEHDTQPVSAHNHWSLDVAVNGHYKSHNFFHEFWTLLHIICIVVRKVLSLFSNLHIRNWGLHQCAHPLLFHGLTYHP
jgi:hypothetical protein